VPFRRRTARTSSGTTSSTCSAGNAGIAPGVEGAGRGTLTKMHEPDPRGGRPRVEDRVCFGAIVFVLFTGIAWQHLPRELGCSPATAHRRLKEWQAAGVFAALHHELLVRLNTVGRIDRTTAVVDCSHIRALQGGFDRALAG
jgi:transposase